MGWMGLIGLMGWGVCGGWDGRDRRNGRDNSKKHNKIRQILIANKNDNHIVATAMNALAQRMSRLW
jgi:hypothetical protein